MKLILLTVCCVIATSLAGPFADKEEKLETAIHDIEAVLQDLGHNVDELSDLPKPKTKLSSPKSLPMEKVLLYTENADKAIAEIEAAGGRVGIQMGHNLLIASLPNDVATKQDAFLHASPEIPPTAPKSTLSNAKVYKQYREDKQKSREYQDPIKWTEENAPKYFPRSEPLRSGTSSYARTMTGRILLCVIVPSGPSPSGPSDPDLEINNDEFEKVKSEILEGVHFWTDRAEDAKVDLRFSIWSGRSYIYVKDKPNCPKYNHAECHDVFAVPALKGYYFNDMNQFVHDCKGIQAGSDGAIVAFISKYNQSHFAYAYDAGPIYYQNGNWGPDKLSMIFSHELAHVVGAKDEYISSTTSCNCQKEYGHGTCTAKNSNCKTCTPKDIFDGKHIAQQDCIMRGDYDAVCDYTKRQIGWC